MKRLLIILCIPAVLLLGGPSEGYAFDGTDLQELRATNRCVKCDLREAKLKGTDLNEANLRGAKLWLADLENANLSRANLRGADLSIANLVRANLTDTDLTNTVLEEIQLTDARLCRTKMPRGVGCRTISGQDTGSSG